jgi:hypothetical protein
MKIICENIDWWVEEEDMSDNLVNELIDDEYDSLFPNPEYVDYEDKIRHEFFKRFGTQFPETIVLEIPDSIWEDEGDSCLAYMLSNESGWLVNGFSYEEVTDKTAGA